MGELKAGDVVRYRQDLDIDFSHMADSRYVLDRRGSDWGEPIWYSTKGDMLSVWKIEHAPDVDDAME